MVAGPSCPCSPLASSPMSDSIAGVPFVRPCATINAAETMAAHTTPDAPLARPWCLHKAACSATVLQISFAFDRAVVQTYPFRLPHHPAHTLFVSHPTRISLRLHLPLAIHKHGPLGPHPVPVLVLAAFIHERVFDVVCDGEEEVFDRVGRVPPDGAGAHAAGA